MKYLRVFGEKEKEKTTIKNTIFENKYISCTQLFKKKMKRLLAKNYISC